MRKMLSEMEFGEEGKVIEIDEGLRKRIAGVGIRVGKKLRMATRQPIKGPVVIELDRVNTSLGFGFANKIVVDVKE